MTDPQLPSYELPLTIRSLTDVGMVRKANEDSFVVVNPDDPHEASTRGRLVVVADGMGGAVGGAHASRIVVETLRDAMYSDHNFPPAQALGESIQLANRNINTEALARPELKGMGSTCTAMLLVGNQAFIGHVGDSRAYLVRQSRILHVTDDHTKVQLLLDSGMITPEEAEVHPERSVLIRSIGPKPTVEVDVLPPIDLEEGDRLVLCSDGLTNHVNDSEILQIVEDHHPQQAVEQLVKLAKERGGSDNITVHVVAAGSPAGRVAVPVTVMETAAPPTIPPGPPPRQGMARSSWFLLILAGLGGTFLGVVIFAWVMSTGNGEGSSLSSIFGGSQGEVDRPAEPPPVHPKTKVKNKARQPPPERTESATAEEDRTGKPEPIEGRTATDPAQADAGPITQPAPRAATVPPAATKYKVLLRATRPKDKAPLADFSWRFYEINSYTAYEVDPTNFRVDLPSGNYQVDCKLKPSGDWIPAKTAFELNGEVKVRCNVDKRGPACNCV